MLVVCFLWHFVDAHLMEGYCISVYGIFAMLDPNDNAYTNLHLIELVTCSQRVHILYSLTFDSVVCICQFKDN